MGEEAAATPFCSFSHPTLTLLLLLALLPPASARARLYPPDPDPCAPAGRRPKPRPDQMTVLMSGYSTARIPLLESIAVSYAASPVVSSVLVLWGDPTTPGRALAQLARNLTGLAFAFNPASRIHVVRQRTDSLNARFLPQPALVRTEAVLVCDDDVEVDMESVEFAFRIWGENRDRLIGMFGRSHGLDLSGRRWIYTVHPDRYSIVLTKFMIVRAEYLWDYSCGGGARMERMRAVVERERNCEDILMNVVVADRVGMGPVLVGARRARDWGDSRNEEEEEAAAGWGGAREAGLSSRIGEHRRRRGECIGEFHRLLGRMPLRYSYGKVVDSVGEQGLCNKGGRLVFCDQYN